MKYISALLITFCALASCSTPAAQPTEITRLDKIWHIANTLNHPYVMVEAHRGAWDAKIPENSMAAIENAIEMKVDVIEIDLRLTKDDRIVLLHDRTLDRTTTLSGQLNEHTFDEVRSARLLNTDGSLTDMIVPTMEEALDAMKNKVLFRLDVKCWEVCLDRVMTALEERDMLDQALADPYALEAFTSRGLSGDKLIYVALNYDDYASYDDIPKEADFIYVKDFPIDNPPVDIMMELDARYRIFMQPYSERRSGNHGDKRSAINPDEGWGWLIDHGADFLLTDTPEPLIKYLESRGRRNLDATQE